MDTMISDAICKLNWEAAQGSLQERKIVLLTWDPATHNCRQWFIGLGAMRKIIDAGSEIVLCVKPLPKVL